MTRLGKILAVSALIAAPIAVTTIPAQPANAQIVVGPTYGYAPYGYGYACGPYNPYYCPGYAYGYGYPYAGVGIGLGWGGGWGWHGGHGHFGRGGGGGHRWHR